MLELHNTFNRASSKNFGLGWRPGGHDNLTS